MKRFFGHVKYRVNSLENGFCSRLLNRTDGITDKRICGESLVAYVPSIFRDDKNGLGGTGSQSTHYIALKRIFSRVRFAPSDAVLDVGCGKGRVLAFLIREKCPCRLYGIEHNAEVGKIAEGWAKRYAQVHIIVGDALRLDYDPYTVLALGRPFLTKTMLAFLERCEDTLTHPVTLVSWCDFQIGIFLRNRPGWEMQAQGKISRLHGMKVYIQPQPYSIWTYDPAKRTGKEKQPDLKKA